MFSYFFKLLKRTKNIYFVLSILGIRANSAGIKVPQNKYLVVYKSA